MSSNNVFNKKRCISLSMINPNTLAILARNLPESAKIHHAQILLDLAWNWDTRPMQSTESIKIKKTLLLEVEWFGVVGV